MRSCASRGANSPGSARNRSSCPRSEDWRSRGGIGGASRSAGATLGRSRLVPLGRQYAAARIGGGGDGPAVGPGLEVVDRIDDAPAELAIGGTGSVGTVLFEGAGRKAQEFGRFLCAQIARREYGEIGSHGSGLRGVR